MFEIKEQINALNVEVNLFTVNINDARKRPTDTANFCIIIFDQILHFNQGLPANIYLLNVNNTNIRKKA